MTNDGTPPKLTTDNRKYIGKNEDITDEARMTFIEHLAELRIRIIRSCTAVVVAFLLCYAVSNQLFDVVRYPLSALEKAKQQVITTDPAKPGEEAKPLPKEDEGAQAEWVALTPLEPFYVKLKLAAFAGLVLASPFIVYQICAFIFPGLKPSERRLAKILLVGCSSFGAFGVIVAYFLVMPMIVPYLIQWTPPGVINQLRMKDTMDFIMIFLAGFALAFQFPMVVLALVTLDLLDPATLKKQRRLAIVILAVAAAVLTPPDPGSMLMMLIPLMGLYELSIWMSYIVIRRKKAAATEITAK